MHIIRWSYTWTEANRQPNSGSFAFFCAIDANWVDKLLCQTPQCSVCEIGHKWSTTLITHSPSSSCKSGDIWYPARYVIMMTVGFHNWYVWEILLAAKLDFWQPQQSSNIGTLSLCVFSIRCRNLRTIWEFSPPVSCQWIQGEKLLASPRDFYSRLRIHIVTRYQCLNFVEAAESWVSLPTKSPIYKSLWNLTAIIMT